MEAFLKSSSMPMLQNHIYVHRYWNHDISSSVFFVVWIVLYARTNRYSLMTTGRVQVLCFRLQEQIRIQYETETTKKQYCVCEIFWCSGTMCLSYPTLLANQKTQGNQRVERLNFWSYTQTRNGIFSKYSSSTKYSLFWPHTWLDGSYY